MPRLPPCSTLFPYTTLFRSLVEHHPAEREIVIDGRYQSSGTRRERGSASPLAFASVVIDVERAGSGIARIAAGQSVELFGRHAERRILHVERPEDSFAQERLERLARDACD